MNQLFKAVTLKDKKFGTGVELEGFGVLTTKFTEEYQKETEVKEETYLYTEFNGIVQIDKDSVREFTGVYENDNFKSKEERRNRPIYNGII